MSYATIAAMSKPPKRPRDPIQLAKAIGDIATGGQTTEAADHRDQEAAEAGRLGGLKGGVKRAKRLAPQERQAIAKKAAAKRWGRLPE
jgi:hypothetical protein